MSSASYCDSREGIAGSSSSYPSSRISSFSLWTPGYSMLNRWDDKKKESTITLYFALLYRRGRVWRVGE